MGRTRFYSGQPSSIHSSRHVSTDGNTYVFGRVLSGGASRRSRLLITYTAYYCYCHYNRYHCNHYYVGGALHVGRSVFVTPPPPHACRNLARGTDTVDAWRRSLSLKRHAVQTRKTHPSTNYYYIIIQSTCCSYRTSI